MPVGWAVRGIIGAGVQAGAFDPLFTNSLARLTNANRTVDGTWPGYTTVGFAVDLTAKTIWMYNPWFGGWNLGTLTAQNPASAAGGMTYTLTGTLYPAAWVQTTDLEGIATANFGGSAFVYPVPSGFSAWDASSTWDAANTGSNVALSGSNLTVSGPLPANTGFGATRSTTGRSSGKWYWEIGVISVGQSGTYESMCLGMVNASANMNAFVDTNGWALLADNPAQNVTGFPTGFLYRMVPSTTNDNRQALGTSSRSVGKLYFEMTAGGTATTGRAIGIANHLALLGATSAGGGGTLGDAASTSIAARGDAGVVYNAIPVAGGPGFSTNGVVYGVAVDFGTSKFWIYDPVLARWNADVIANQNPATGTGGGSFAGMGLPAYPAAQVIQWSSVDYFTLNTGPTFSNPVPSGFSAWG